MQFKTDLCHHILSKETYTLNLTIRYPKSGSDREQIVFSSEPWNWAGSDRKQFSVKAPYCSRNWSPIIPITILNTSHLVLVFLLVFTW